MYEVKQVNQPIDIQAPKDCSGAAEDIPMMADAADQSAFGGTTMYTSPSTFKDVVAFYEKEMKAKGWQAKEDGGMSAEGRVDAVLHQRRPHRAGHDHDVIPATRPRS